MVTHVDTQANSAPPDQAMVPTTVLEQILARLDRMERRMDELATPVQQAPALVAAVTDTVDEWTKAAQARGVDLDASLNAGGRLVEQLTAPETLARLERIINRLNAVEESLAVAAQLPGTVAMLSDTVDQWIQQAQKHGVDLDESLKAVLPTLATLADPKVQHALETLMKQAPQLAELVDQGPKLVAATVDSIDGVLGRLNERGVDVQAMSESVAVALSKLGEVLNSPQYTALMNSGVLDPSTLDMVGKAGSALVRARMEACVEKGMFGALQATSDRDVQRSIGFAIKFAQSFGQELNQPDNIKHLAALKQQPARLPAP